MQSFTSSYSFKMPLNHVTAKSTYLELVMSIILMSRHVLMHKTSVEIAKRTSIRIHFYF